MNRPALASVIEHEAVHAAVAMALGLHVRWMSVDEQFLQSRGVWGNPAGCLVEMPHGDDRSPAHRAADHATSIMAAVIVHPVSNEASRGDIAEAHALAGIAGCATEEEQEAWVGARVDRARELATSEQCKAVRAALAAALAQERTLLEGRIRQVERDAIRRLSERRKR